MGALLTGKCLEDARGYQQSCTKINGPCDLVGDVAAAGDADHQNDGTTLWTSVNVIGTKINSPATSAADRTSGVFGPASDSSLSHATRYTSDDMRYMLALKNFRAAHEEQSAASFLGALSTSGAGAIEHNKNPTSQHEAVGSIHTANELSLTGSFVDPLGGSLASLLATQEDAGVSFFADQDDSTTRFLRLGRAGTHSAPVPPRSRPNPTRSTHGRQVVRGPTTGTQGTGEIFVPSVRQGNYGMPAAKIRAAGELQQEMERKTSSAQEVLEIFSPNQLFFQQDLEVVGASGGRVNKRTSLRNKATPGRNTKNASRTSSAVVVHASEQEVFPDNEKTASRGRR
ncbi:unnamed protein product [Amoebophrya sp. A120]|nr:unnamed protein product [Amoebophrya sp. A120]|eukprot:GSA120T00012466001.1